MANRILLIEDEEKLARMVELELTYEGYQVEKAFDGRTGLDRALAGAADLILLDIMLPRLNGLEVLRRYQKEGGTAPVILLTARDTVVDKVSGLDSGAVDYVTKPFAIEELLARIRVNLKKHRADRTAGTGARTAGKLRIEPASYGASFDGEPIMLTKKEFDLLNYLWQHEGTAVTRDELLSNVWGYEFAGDTNIVDVYIRYLRQKIDDKFGVKTIHTIRAVGYMFRYE